MKTVNGRKTKSCANCGGMGTNPRNPNKPCFFCHGTGQVESQLPYPFWWPINLVVTQPGVLVSTVPQLLFPGAPADTNQQGTNPARYKLGSDAPFQWMFNLLSATSPDVIGDARQWLALLLTDASTQGYPFMPAPVLASLFAGDARYPWPILEALTFGEQTEIVLTGYPVVYQGVTQQIGLADGATATFSGTIYVKAKSPGPELPLGRFLPIPGPEFPSRFPLRSPLIRWPQLLSSSPSIRACNR